MLTSLESDSRVCTVSDVIIVVGSLNFLYSLAGRSVKRGSVWLSIGVLAAVSSSCIILIGFPYEVFKFICCSL